MKRTQLVVSNKLPGEHFVSPYGNKLPMHLTKALEKPEVSFEGADFDQFYQSVVDRHKDLSARALFRNVQNYGTTMVTDVLSDRDKTSRIESLFQYPQLSSKSTRTQSGIPSCKNAAGQKVGFPQSEMAANAGQVSGQVELLETTTQPQQIPEDQPESQEYNTISPRLNAQSRDDKYEQYQKRNIRSANAGGSKTRYSNNRNQHLQHHYTRQSTKEMLQTQSAIALFLTEQRAHKLLRNSAAQGRRTHQKTIGVGSEEQVTKMINKNNRCSLSTDNQQFDNRLLEATSSTNNDNQALNSRIFSGSSNPNNYGGLPSKVSQPAMRQSWNSQVRAPTAHTSTTARLKPTIVQSQYLSSLDGLTISGFMRKSGRNRVATYGNKMK